MSQDKQNPLQRIGSTEAKTPAERAQQIQELQELQRQMEAQHAQAPAEVHQAAPAAPAAPLDQAAAVFEVHSTAPLSKLTPPNPAEQAAYAGAQKDVSALFGSKGSEIELTGNPWKIIPFGEVVPGLVDLKKPLADYDVKVPEKAVKLKEGNLFNLTVTPKAGGEAPQKIAALVDNAGKLKGAEFKSPEALKTAIAKIPSFAEALFGALFGDSVKGTDPKHLRMTSVAPGKASAFEVVLERRNELTGVWSKGELTLNNFGQKVPPSPAQPRRHDLIVANYFLDRFGAA